MTLSPDVVGSAQNQRALLSTKAPQRRLISEGVRGWSPSHRYPAQFGEFFERRAAAKAPPTAGFYTAERHLRLVVHRGAVDVAHSCFQALRKFHRFINVAAENRARKSILGVIRNPQSVFTVFRDDQGDNRTKGLFAVDSHFRRHAEQNGRRVTWTRLLRAAQHPRAFGCGIGDEALDSIHRVLIDHRADLRVWFERITDFEAG
jgi:hypothetical protein